MADTGRRRSVPAAQAKKAGSTTEPEIDGLWVTRTSGPSWMPTAPPTLSTANVKAPPIVTSHAGENDWSAREAVSAPLASLAPVSVNDFPVRQEGSDAPAAPTYDSDPSMPNANPVARCACQSCQLRVNAGSVAWVTLRLNPAIETAGRVTVTSVAGRVTPLRSTVTPVAVGKSTAGTDGREGVTSTCSAKSSPVAVPYESFWTFRFDSVSASQPRSAVPVTSQAGVKGPGVTEPLVIARESDPPQFWPPASSANWPDAVSW